MTWEDWGHVATLFSAAVAASALGVAAFQLWMAAKVTREASALAAHRDYLRLCFDHPEYSSTEQFLAHCKLVELPDLLEERELSHVKYLWFLSELLNTAEQIVNYVASKEEWRQLVIDQIRYHHPAIKLCWIEWECHYGEALRSIVEAALKSGPYPGLEVRVAQKKLPKDALSAGG